eukprot:scaffold91121_cov85-Phaeocystis_antarctica.AAC.1
MFLGPVRSACGGRRSWALPAKRGCGPDHDMGRAGRLVGDAVNRGVHRRRGEGGVHEGAEAVGEDERPEEVG